MSRSDISLAVLEFFARWKDEELAIVTDAEPLPLGFDSLSLLELVLHVEEKCGCQIPDAALDFRVRGARVCDVIKKLHEAAVFPEETDETKETKG